METNSLLFGMLLTGLIVAYILVIIIAYMTVFNKNHAMPTKNFEKEELKEEVVNLQTQLRKSKKQVQDMVTALDNSTKINTTFANEIATLKAEIEQIYQAQNKYKQG
jgi:peptidoglycan hydrolase CwlO-like protein